MRFEADIDDGYMLTYSHIAALYNFALEIYELNTADRKNYFQEKKVNLSITFNQEDTLACDSIEEVQEMENLIDKITNLRINTSTTRHNSFNIYFSPYGIRYEIEVENKKEYVYFKKEVQKILKGASQEFPATFINTPKKWVFPCYFIILAILNSTLQGIIPDEKSWVKIISTLVYIYYMSIPLFFGSKLYPKNIFLINKGVDRYDRNKKIGKNLIYLPIMIVIIYVPTIIDFLKLLLNNTVPSTK